MSENTRASIERVNNNLSNILNYIDPNNTIYTNTRFGQKEVPPGQASPGISFGSNGPGKNMGSSAIPEISRSIGGAPTWWFTDPTGEQSIYKSLFEKIGNAFNQVKNAYIDISKNLFKPVEIRIGYKDRNPTPPGRKAGATDPFAINYDPTANWSDGSELYPFYGDPGPIDSRNVQGNQSRYYGGSFVPNVCLALFPENNLNRDIPYYPYTARNYYSYWRLDNSVYGNNNSYYENATFTDDPPEIYERKGMIYEFLKAAEYQLDQPPVVYQERQGNLPAGVPLSDSSQTLSYKTGNTPRREFKPPKRVIGGGSTASISVPRRFEIRVNDTLWEYSGDVFYVGNPSNGTWRPGTIPSYYNSIKAITKVLSGTNTSAKAPSASWPAVEEVFTFVLPEETTPIALSGFDVYKNGEKVSDSTSLSAKYDDSGTNKVTIFDFTNIPFATPIAIRNDVASLSGTESVPSVNTFLEGNNIDQGRSNTFILLEHNGIKSQDITLPFDIFYANALVPSISGRITIA